MRQIPNYNPENNSKLTRKQVRRLKKWIDKVNIIKGWLDVRPGVPSTAKYRRMRRILLSKKYREKYGNIPKI